MRALKRDDAAYPDFLNSIYDPPETLYVRGRLRPIPALAIVGTRRPTQYGRRMARLFAQACSRAGIVVVSGLARGIDTEAHRAVVREGGVTWAVLGCGLDRVYPPENAGLVEEILDHDGAVLGELAPGMGPLARNFPARNRIISGLSLGTIVIEGAQKSGSLITARAALEQGREVFAVPGPSDSDMSAAPHYLLKQGAVLVRNFEDVLEELPMLAERMDKKGVVSTWGDAPESGCADEERKILKLLGSHSQGLEELLSETAWPLPKMVRVLTKLETLGIISALPGQRYGRS